jgi:hypothetical protein
MAWWPPSFAVARSWEMAARRWPSRAVVDRPAVCRVMVSGLPTGLPEASIVIAARCPVFTSTASTPLLLSSTMVTGVAVGSFQEASRNQRPRSVSLVTS